MLAKELTGKWVHRTERCSNGGGSYMSSPVFVLKVDNGIYFVSDISGASSRFLPREWLDGSWALWPVELDPPEIAVSKGGSALGDYKMKTPQELAAIDELSEHLIERGAVFAEEAVTKALIDLDSDELAIEWADYFPDVENPFDPTYGETITDDELIERFEVEVLPETVQQYGADQCALDQAFNNWTDGLCRNGEISDRQYNEVCAPDYSSGELGEFARDALNALRGEG